MKSEGAVFETNLFFREIDENKATKAEINFKAFILKENFSTIKN
jgi:hypothetical protein